MLWYSARRHAAPIPGAPAVVAEQLSLRYPGAVGLAVQSASFTVPTGVRVALVGANGSGKSTLLKAVAGLLKPVGGTLRIYGLTVDACHHRVAYLPQRGDIDWHFPVSLERLVLAGRYVHRGWLRRPSADDRQRVTEVLDALELSHLAHRQISALSGGQQQRALLARALVQEADLLLLDEPLAAVDVRSRTIIDGVMERLRRDGKSALVATHHLDRLDDEFDHVVTMDDGRVVPRQQQVGAAWTRR